MKSLFHSAFVEWRKGKMNRKIVTGAIVVVISVLVARIPDFTALWVGIIWAMAGLMWVAWDYLPGEVSEENASTLELMMADWLAPNDEEAENAHPMRAIGVVLFVFTFFGYLLSPYLIDAWGIWATLAPGGGLVTLSYRKWIEVHLLPNPLR